ncbi:unnamed protein product [Oncorhynchus mykiss]|uniref:Ig-like domain-containing protein n=1 Tax=Oncorhynchus mykiss TaxID=8022 RepID=A0A060X6Y4_ONCMY|nr:unnamed protein product [Oncorhynchus mykiss]
MHLSILLSALLSIPVSLGWNEDFQIVCSGQEFRLPVYSGSRIVTFTPSYPPGPRRVLLENNNLKDPRFEWTKDRTLLLKDVTHGDQGLYSIKLSSGFTDETVRLTVSECIKTFRRGYGETFQHNIPKDGSLLEFSPRGSPPDSQPVVLWNRTDLETSEAGRGRLGSDGRVWVAERVTQADQGNYTLRDENGKVISRSKLTVNDKTARWRAVLKSISVPSGMFVTLAGFILFMKRYPNCSLTMIINGLRGHHTPAANPPRGNVQVTAGE